MTKTCVPYETHKETQENDSTESFKNDAMLPLSVQLESIEPGSFDNEPDTLTTRAHITSGDMLDDCLKSLEYSKRVDSSLRRGELWLLPCEAEVLLSYIKSQGLDTAWCFKEIRNIRHPPLPVSKDGKRVQRKKTHRTAPAKPKPQNVSHDKPFYDKISSTQAQNQPLHSKCKDEVPTPIVHRTSRFSQSQLKKLPDWAQRLHCTLSWLCQTEMCRPFVNEIHAKDPKYPEVYNAIQPGLTPLGLSTIISKLEQNAYQSSLDVFNDVYCVWLCAYRTYTPGSALWLQTYQASRTFLQQVANQPLKDDFTPNDTLLNVYSGKSTFIPVDKRNLSVSGGVDRQGSASVDQILQEFLTFCDIADQSRTTTQSTNGPNHKRSNSQIQTSSRHIDSAANKKKTNKRIKTQNNEAITDFERTRFQKHLSELGTSQHRMLFEAFRRTAVWKSIESGEVELDDARTSPPVFRKMIAWCHTQLTNRIALQKRQKHISSSAHNCNDTSPISSTMVAATTTGYTRKKPLAQATTSFTRYNHFPGEPNMTSSSSSSSLTSSDYQYDDDDDHTEGEDKTVFKSQGEEFSASSVPVL